MPASRCTRISARLDGGGRLSDYAAMIARALKRWFNIARRRPAPPYNAPVALLSHDLDDPAVIDNLRQAFAAERETEPYRAIYRVREPLVTVCITTADRGALLAERALTSMAIQTYRRLQVIVAGDCCDDDTAERVAAFNDPRFTFVNLPERGPYPPPGFERWCVAGTYPANAALAGARGDFITHIDEDDTFTDDRIEVLVNAIQASEADIVHHPFWWEDEDHSWRIIGDGNFAQGQTGTSMVLYHRWLARVPWDVNAFRYAEPGDWNRFRKFVALGTRPHFVARPLTWHWRYPLREPFAAKPGERFLDSPSTGDKDTATAVKRHIGG